MEAAALERKLMEMAGTAYAVYFRSEHLAWRSMLELTGSGRYCEVVLSPLAAPEAAAAIAELGADPVFAEIWEDTLNIKPKELEMSCSPETGILIVSDFAGHPADMAPIRRIARSYRLRLVEDVSTTIGCNYQGETVGSLADFNFISLDIFTGGIVQGSVILTNNNDLYIGLQDFCLRMDQFAAEGKDSLLQPAGELLDRLRYSRQKRRRNAMLFSEVLADAAAAVRLPCALKRLEADWSFYVLRLRRGNRREICGDLAGKGLAFTLPPKPLYLHTAFRQLGYNRQLFPVTEDYFLNGINIPLDQFGSEEEAQKAAVVIKEIILSH